MATRTNGIICWYCNSEPNEPCEACDEVNALNDNWYNGIFDFMNTIITPTTSLGKTKK